MKILFINEVCGHTSTGKICAELAERYESKGHEVKIAYGRDGYVPEKYNKYAVRIGTDWDVRLHALLTRLTDRHGLGSKRATREFLKWAKEYNPDLLWLHNLHGYYINYELLFEWIKKRPNMKVKWTLHDCWSFTGHCVHFTIVGCNKWLNECYNCPQKKEYPASILIDNSRSNYVRKRLAFTEINNLIIYTPSEWLKKRVENSFLKDNVVEVNRNEVSSEIFKPTRSSLRDDYDIKNKIIILGVANIWTMRKRIDIFIKLAEKLDKNYQIVLVGLSEKQKKDLPDNIVGICKTNDQVELAGIYTASDIFINPSLEETFGMTPVEASMCGTLSIVMRGTACEELERLYDNIYAVSPDIDSIYNKVMELTARLT